MKLHIQNRYKGGVKASRNNPKCYRKQNQKEIQSSKKKSFLRKHLSLEIPYDSLGISENLINSLKVGASGELSINYGLEFYALLLRAHMITLISLFFPHPVGISTSNL